MRKLTSMSDLILVIFVYTLLCLLILVTLLPFFQVVTISLSPESVTNKFGYHFFPTILDFEGYNEVIHSELIWRAYENTIVRTCLGTALTVLLTFLAAYPLSKKKLPHRKLLTGFIVITMFFSGGLIPTYLLVKNLGLINSIWALVLPGAISAFYTLIVRNFVGEIPESLEESAKIDGANELYILFRIILPLSLPILATISLYTGVWHWNSWFDSMLYTTDVHKQVLQLFLRRLILEGQVMQTDSSFQGVVAIDSDAMKMAAIVVSSLPIICVYPFLQKYFIKGSLVGSIKG